MDGNNLAKFVFRLYYTQSGPIELTLLGVVAGSVRWCALSAAVFQNEASRERVTGEDATQVPGDHHLPQPAPATARHR